MALTPAAGGAAVAPGLPTRRRLDKALGRDWATAWPFLVPTLIVIIGLVGYPFVSAILLTFQDKTVGADAVWVGLRNYEDLLSGSEIGDLFRITIVNSIVYTAVAIGAKLVLGLAQALILNEAIPARNIMRGLLFLPWTIPSLIVALTWKWMYNGTQVGLLNMVQLKLGLSQDLIQWLSNPDIAMWAVVLVAIWQGTPFWTMNILAGLQSISAEMYEAAAIDGANIIQRFRHITLPGLENVLAITCMLSTIWTANGINYVYILTGGGPANATMIFPMLAYEIGIAGAQRLGMGATIGLFFFPFFLVLIFLLSRRMLQDINK